LQKMSQTAGVTIEEISCDKCLSDHVYGRCIDCRCGFRQCAKDKKVTWCFQCPDFPCKRLKDFSEIHVDELCNHRRVIDNLHFMQDYGIEKWIEKYDNEGVCPNCGKIFYTYSQKCAGCYAGVK